MRRRKTIEVRPRSWWVVGGERGVNNVALHAPEVHPPDGQGWSRSPVVRDGDHLLAVLRTIEANPLRARLVTELPEYRWSSDQGHGSPLFSPFRESHELGRREADRRAATGRGTDEYA
jgi:hypothetical protein